MQWKGDTVNVTENSGRGENQALRENARNADHSDNGRLGRRKGALSSVDRCREKRVETNRKPGATGQEIGEENPEEACLGKPWLRASTNLLKTLEWQREEHRCRWYSPRRIL